jgi:hypothetical protein
MDNQQEVQRTFLSNRVVEGKGIFRLMANCQHGVVKYSIDKQLPSLHWKSGPIFTKYINAVNEFLTIQ